MKYVLMTKLLAHADAVATAPYEMPTVLKEPEPVAIVEQAEVEPAWLTFEATAYVATCEGCIGITKTGIDVRNTTRHNGRHIIAVDPAVIPLGSVVQIRLADGRTIEAEAQDTGGAIKGRRLDLLVGDYDSAIQFGRQDVELRIIKEAM